MTLRNLLKDFHVSFCISVIIGIMLVCIAMRAESACKTPADHFYCGLGQGDCFDGMPEIGLSAPCKKGAKLDCTQKTVDGDHVCYCPQSMTTATDGSSLTTGISVDCP
jgi:hypothetical protein